MTALPRSGEGSAWILVHGANRDLCVCGSPVPSRRVRVRGCDDAGLPGGRTSRRRAALLERVSRTCGDVSCGRGCIRAGGHSDSCGRMPRQLGARTGSSGASRLSPQTAARSSAQGRARRLVRAVLAYAVRRSRHRSSEGSRVPVRDVRREPLRRRMGPGLRTRCRECLAPVTAPPGERPQPAVPGRRGGAGSGERSPRRRRCRRVDGDLRLAALAHRKDSAGQPGISGRARGESAGRHACGDPRRLRASGGASWRAGADACVRRRQRPTSPSERPRATLSGGSVRGSRASSALRGSRPVQLGP